jgi:hypothetical protein
MRIRSSPTPNDSEKQKLIDELKQDLAALEEYETKHGSFTEFVLASQSARRPDELKQP